MVKVIGTVQLPTSYNGVNFGTLLAPYAPPQQVSWFAGVLSGSPSADTAGGFPRVYVTGTAISLNGIQASQNGQNVRINGEYPMAGYYNYIVS